MLVQQESEQEGDTPVTRKRRKRRKVTWESSFLSEATELMSDNTDQQTRKRPAGGGPAPSRPCTASSTSWATTVADTASHSAQPPAPPTPDPASTSRALCVQNKMCCNFTFTNEKLQTLTSAASAAETRLERSLDGQGSPHLPLSEGKFFQGEEGQTAAAEEGEEERDKEETTSGRDVANHRTRPGVSSKLEVCRVVGEPGRRAAAPGPDCHRRAGPPAIAFWEEAAATNRIVEGIQNSRLKCRQEGCNKSYVRPRAREIHEMSKHNLHIPAI
ncbi:hypothetical protein Bbelb_291150 [Branchiostoma belcheri]|nr:hypothetical protein Bbelb_291150 [Branchiostoma belcheri]